MKAGSAHLGVTGEDLVREQMADADSRVEFVKPLGFGFADVVVAVPNFWIDVATMADLDAISASFQQEHGRRLRVATKYLNLTRRFFSAHGVTDYRIVESLGATEGTPAAGSADLIVDITTTGETLRANGLRILDDGIILKSQANLVAARGANWSGAAMSARTAIFKRLGL
jgi:ATP phosphoribosyltransferase